VTASAITRVDTVGFDDSRWAAAGVSARRLGYWTMRGYLRTVGDPTPGSGFHRRWPVGEIGVAARMVRAVAAGLMPEAAAVAARASGPVELGPGVWVGLADIEEATDA
jgi:hypothetical protein